MRQAPAVFLRLSQGGLSRQSPGSSQPLTSLHLLSGTMPQYPLSRRRYGSTYKIVTTPDCHRDVVHRWSPYHRDTQVHGKGDRWPQIILYVSSSRCIIIRLSGYYNLHSLIQSGGAVRNFYSGMSPSLDCTRPDHYSLPQVHSCHFKMGVDAAVKQCLNH